MLGSLWLYSHLNILLVEAVALVIIVWQVVLAEEQLTGVALAGEVVQLLAGLLGAVLAHVRQLHCFLANTDVGLA